MAVSAGPVLPCRCGDHLGQVDGFGIDRGENTGGAELRVSRPADQEAVRHLTPGKPRAARWPVVLFGWLRSVCVVCDLR
jgi:hypothetical protein